MASSLEELLAKDGFKASKEMTAKSRSSFHYGASSEPLHSLEDRLCVSSERIKTQRAKSKTASRYQITSNNKSDPHTLVANRRSRRDNNIFLGDKMDCNFTNSGTTTSSSSNNDSGAGDFHSNSDKVSNNVKRDKDKYFNEHVEKENPIKHSNMVIRHLSGNRKSIIAQENSFSRSDSNRKSFNDSRNINSDHHGVELQDSSSSFALDEVAVQALVSILNGYVKRFLKDEDFRSALRHNCFSSLNFVHLEEENNSETKVITSLEQAIETIEQTATASVSGEPIISSIYNLKRTTMQLSIITGLSLNDLKYECTCDIPNYKLSACAHLYLSVVYMIQRKNKVSAKHLLQVFCESPFQARTVLLPHLWDHLFSPQLSHLKAWYNKEAQLDTPSKAKKLKLVQKVYNEHLDSGTHMFAVYYKDWLTEGVESPSIPSIGIPSSLSLSATCQEGSSVGHSFESSSSTEPFSPQPMVSKKLYDSVFCSSTIKPGVSEAEDDDDDDDDDDEDEEEDSLEYCLIGSYGGSTVVRQTLIYESQTVQFTDQNTKDITPTLPLDARHPLKGTSMEAAKGWQERNPSNATKNSFSLETNLNGHKVALPHQKAKEISLKKPKKTSSTLTGSCFSRIPKEFTCPLTGNIFEEPVTLESGETFEREAIKAWFEKGNTTCPVTGNTLECVAMPFTNLILKRLIDNWKSEELDHLLDFASQTVENSKEAAVFKLEGLFSSLKEEDKSTYAKNFISLGVLSLLFRRFEVGNMDEKSHVLPLLINFIQADSGCIYRIATSINRKCLLKLLHSKRVTPTKNAVLFLTNLLSMKRRKDVTSFISGLVGDDIFSIMDILLMYLNKSSPIEKPLIAVLLLHFDLLAEPQNFSIYREKAVNGIALALDASLNDEKAREQCCKALLTLCGHFSSIGKITKTSSILKQPEAYTNDDSAELKSPPGHDQQLDVTFSSEDEEVERDEEFLMNLLEMLIEDGKSPFLKAISRCLDSRHLDLVRACLITITWLSSSLSTLFNAGLHIPSFIAIISQLKGILKNGEAELKTLASMSLLNFTKISGLALKTITISSVNVYERKTNELVTDPTNIASNKTS